MSTTRPDLARITLLVLFLGGLLGASLWILAPFLTALVWAAMIVIATWPILIWVQKRLWKRRWLAAAAMSLALALVFVAPLSLAIGAVVVNGNEIVDWVRSLATLHPPAPPAWVAALPLVGERISATWRAVADTGLSELAHQLAPHTEDLVRWFVAHAGGFGLLALEILLMLALCAILYTWGEDAVALISRFGRRLGGARGESVVHLAGKAIRAVALGVVLTAIIQSALGGVALAVAQVPFAAPLTGLMFLLAVAQIGAVPVLLCAVGWLYWKDATGAAIALLVWTVFVGAIDNVLRPLLIKQGADLPLLLIFAGVIGGLIAFGLVGIFIGPVVLAVAYTLLLEWMDDRSELS